MSEHEQWQWQAPGTAWKGAGLYPLVIPENDPRQAKVEATPLGLAVLDIQRGLSSFYPEIQVLHYALMPDHLHAIWYVRRAMPRGILSAVRGYWQMVKKIGRLSSFSPNSIRTNCQERATNLRDELGKEAYDALNPIFTEMPHLRPMGHNTQLPATVRYLDMNPERLATKRLKPGYFRVQEGVEIGGRTYAAVGNIAVLHAEMFQPVHVRRTMVEAADHGETQPLRDYMNGCVLAARKGAVMVSPFISPKEKEVLAVLMQEQRPVIYIADNGFRDYYKPSDGLFDAVAAGRMLILSPWPYDADKRHVTREECVEMNRMAEEISSFTPTDSRENHQESI